MTDLDLAAAPAGGSPDHPESRDVTGAVGEAVEPPVRTGVPAVDEVLTAVDALGDRPVEEHVAVFEQAHDRLRQALDVRPEQS